MLSPESLRAFFSKAVPYDAYIAHAKPHERPGWDSMTARTKLSESQRTLVASFARRINVLTVSGTWCGDCVQQCPIFHRIAQAHVVASGAEPDAPGIDLRFLERDTNTDLADQIRICGGKRVPTVIFMNEDFDFVSILGDRTLSRYRAIAASSLGPACPMPGAPLPDDQLAATTQDWVNEFERVALLLRLSAKLRERHGD